MSSHTLFQHGITCSPHCKKARKRNKRYIKKKTKNISICRYHCLCKNKRNPNKLKNIKNQTNNSSNNLIQQGHRIQGQHVQINHISNTKIWKWKSSTQYHLYFLQRKENI